MFEVGPKDCQRALRSRKVVGRVEIGRSRGVGALTELTALFGAGVDEVG